MTSVPFVRPAKSVWPNAVCNDSKLSSSSRLGGNQTEWHHWHLRPSNILVCVQERPRGPSDRQVRPGHHQKWISFTIYWARMGWRSKWDSSQNLRIINFTSASFPAVRPGDLSILPNCDSINASNFIFAKQFQLIDKKRLTRQ